MESLSKRIKAFRKLKGFTQIELADKMGVSVSLLGTIERGTREADLVLIEKISKVLGIEIDELLEKKK